MKFLGISTTPGSMHHLFTSIRLVSYFSRKKNYYEILGVLKDASADEIRQAFVRKSNKLHPDKQRESDHRIGWSSQSQTERFMLVKEAYDCLRKPEKRRSYDDAVISREGFLVEATSSKFKESTVVDLNKRRNETYVGPSGRSVVSNHFRDPEKEYYDEKRKNRFLYLIGFSVFAIIGLNAAYVSFLQYKKKQDFDNS